MEAQNNNQPQPTPRGRRKWLRWLAVPAGVLSLAVSALVSSSAAHGRAKEVRRREQLPFSVRAVLNAIRNQDVRTITRLSSKEGVSFSQVTLERKPADHKVQSGRNIESDPLRFPFTHDSIAWHVAEMHFDKDEMRGKEFKELLKQFSQLVNVTDRQYPADTRFSMSTPIDVVDGASLPALSGKVAAGSIWYVYFKRERSSWRASKLEYVAK